MIKLNTNYDRKTFSKAFESLLLSIKLNSIDNKDGYYYIGFLYENGYTSGKQILPDIVQAYRHYKKAMKRGHTKARTKVAIALSNGIENYFRKKIKYKLWSYLRYLQMKGILKR